MASEDYGLDIKLMRTLYILLSQCSVSRSAQILGQSQPSVSLALRRLRLIFNDPLLVRSGVRLVPTERGLELHHRVGSILDEIEHMASSARPFDPSLFSKHMRMYAANCLGTFFAPSITRRFLKAAPNAYLDFSPAAAEHDIFGQLEDGTLDLVIGNWPTPRENLRSSPLLETEIVLVVRRDHAIAEAGSVDLDRYLTLAHLSPTPPVNAGLSPIDAILGQLNLRRNIQVTVSEFALVPHMLGQTDLVFASSKPYAEQMVRTMPFVIVKAPPELGTMKFYTLWHERSHASPANRWLRGMLRKVAQEIATASDTVPPRKMVDVPVGIGSRPN